MTLDRTYPLSEVATALDMTPRFLRDYIRDNHIEHLRIGKGDNARIKFTATQYEALRSSFVQAPVAQSVTTGRRRRSA